MTDPSDATHSHESLQQDVPAALAAWGIAPSATATPVTGGTLNWNFDVHTAEGRFFLRCYRSNLETPRIEGEHELLAWVAVRDVPVPVPIPSSNGETIVVIDDQRWALFPWMPGEPQRRGTLTPAQAASLGGVHGRLQATLAAHPSSVGASLSMRWDKAQSLAILARLLETARQKDVEGWIVDGIARQRRLLEELDVLPPDAFASLPCQLLHGDFHDQQVLFDGDAVTAVVDWEIWHTDSRAWELVRALAFSQMLDSPLLAPYLAGYREHIRLSEGEARLALRLWFQSRVVGLWAWWAYIMEGNERVRDFFPAMIAELEQLTDDRWTESIASRLVAAACA